MNALIVYDSQFGNTERIARAIAERLESARLLRAEEAGALERTECDLLIVASPTQRHGVSPALQEWLERLPRGALKDVPPQGEKRRHEMERLEPGEEERAAERAASILVRMGAARPPGAAR